MFSMSGMSYLVQVLSLQQVMWSVLNVIVDGLKQFVFRYIQLAFDMFLSSFLAIFMFLIDLDG